MSVADKAWIALMVLWAAVYCALVTSFWPDFAADSLQHIRRLANILTALCIGNSTVILLGAL